MRPLACLLLLFAGCGPASRAPGPLPRGVAWVPRGSPWEVGPLPVQVLDLSEGELEAPLPLRLHAPAAPGTWAVVQFQHGFTADVRTYGVMLAHLASHGFVVVAPQMYPADGIPLGKPWAAWEAEDAAAVAGWSARHAAAAVGSASTGAPLSLVGHSRGGKVAWLVAKAGRVRFSGLVGVDPVDGTGSALLAAQAEALPGPVEGLPRSLVIGMELGGACAPEGDNHAHFFERTSAPTRHAVVAGHGHGDMLDPEVGTGGLCLEGPDKDRARATVAGLVTAQLRAWLYADDSTNAALGTAAGAPLEVALDAR